MTGGGGGWRRAGLDFSRPPSSVPNETFPRPGGASGLLFVFASHTGKDPESRGSTRGRLRPHCGSGEPPLSLWDQQPSRPRSSRQRSELTPLAPKIQGS